VPGSKFVEPGGVHARQQKQRTCIGEVAKMSAAKFVVGMLFVVAIVTIWSILDAASWGTVLLRAGICAVVLQLGYFLVVLVLVGREPARHAKRPEAAPAKPVRPNPKMGGEQKL
jgi:exopolysaccharide production repressor protein